MTRTLTLRVRVSPTRSSSCSCNTRSSLACVASGPGPISSRNNVPPSASSNRPGLSLSAPVNAPFTCPKNSLSKRPSGTALQFNLTRVRSLRALCSWMARAPSSFPVPLSPVDQDGSIGGRNELNLLHHLSQAGTSADDIAEVLFAADFIEQVGVLSLEPRLLLLHQHL